MDRFSKSCVDLNKFKPQKKRRGLFSLFKTRTDTTGAQPSFQKNERPTMFARRNSNFRIPSHVGHKVNWKKSITIVLLIAIPTAWLGLMLYLPFFQINTVTINGLRLLNQSEINNYIHDRYIAHSWWPKNNYFLINANIISSDITSKYAVNKVEIKKIFSHEIQINIEEKITSIIYDNGQNYFLLDGEGTVVKTITLDQETSPASPVLDVTSTTTSQIISPDLITSTTSPQIMATTTLFTATNTHKPAYIKFFGEYYDMPIFYDARELNVHDKQINVLPAELIKSIIEWKQALKENGVGDVNYFTSNNPTAGITAVLSQPWNILVQPTNDMPEQIQNLKTILANPEVKPTEYIDLRFKERVFWK
ncbi:MAG: hypothetical protein WC457_01065 [Patescibacteria group bacterium]